MMKVNFIFYDFGLTISLIVGACAESTEISFSSEKEAMGFMQKIYSEMKSYNEEGNIVVSNPCPKVKGTVFRFQEGNLTSGSLGVDFKTLWLEFGKEITRNNFNINNHDRKILKEIDNS